MQFKVSKECLTAEKTAALQRKNEAPLTTASPDRIVPRIPENTRKNW